MRKFIAWDLCAALSLILATGCYSSHKVESTHEIKPIHITIDVNVKIQNALQKEFKEDKDIAKKISDKDADKALEEYLAKAGE